MFKDASANLLNENNPPVEPHNLPNESNTPVKCQRFEFMRRTENSVNISCILTGAVHGTMSADTKYKATLLILQFRFLPERKDRRVCEAKIELRFDAARPGNKLPEVECMSFEGIHSLFPTTQTETKTIGVNYRANIDTSIKMERTVSCDTSSSNIIEGEKLVVDNTLPNRVVKWTIRENETLKIGVPTLIQVAVRIRRMDEAVFTCIPKLKCKMNSRTSLASLFGSTPKQDPILLDPKTEPTDLAEVYNAEELGSIDLLALGNVVLYNEAGAPAVRSGVQRQK